MTYANPEEFARSVVEQLVKAGFEALWAGGCVRDRLLGIPASDFDVATSARPEQVRDLFGKHRTLAVGMNFGVVVVLSGHNRLGPVEVATFRTDAAYSDGRHPDAVVFSSAEEDAKRRDFTINGMFYNPISETTVDYVGGKTDLEHGIIRAIGAPEKRIGEDKLRMLRGIRFASRFDFSLEPSTFHAIKANAEHVRMVSGERIADELRKTFRTRHASRALDLLSETGLLRFTLEEFARHWPEYGTFACSLVSGIEEADWLEKFATACWGLLHAHQKSFTELLDCIKVQLKFANKEVDAIRFSFQAQPKLERARKLPWSSIQPLLIDANIAVAMQILRARCAVAQQLLHVTTNETSTTELRETLHWLETKLALPSEELDPGPLLTGADLIELGMRPSAEFRRLLDSVRQRQLDGLLTNRAEAIAVLDTL